MRILKPIFLTIIVGILLAAAFIFSGVYSVAADEPHAAITKWVLAVARSRSIEARLDEVEAPGDLDSAERIARGGKLYGENCAGCHLGPGREPTIFSRGLNPEPPNLMAHSGHHSPEKLFWIVKHGIKMTAMPAWGKNRNDESLWDVTGFLMKLPGMSAEDFTRYTKATGNSDS